MKFCLNEHHLDTENTEYVLYNIYILYIYFRPKTRADLGLGFGESWF